MRHCARKAGEKQRGSTNVSVCPNLKKKQHTYVLPLGVHVMSVKRAGCRRFGDKSEIEHEKTKRSDSLKPKNTSCRELANLDMRNVT